MFAIILFMVFYHFKKGTSFVIQWLRLGDCNARGTGLIHGRGTKIPQNKKINKTQTPHPVWVLHTDSLGSKVWDGGLCSVMSEHGLFGTSFFWS